MTASAANSLRKSSTLAPDSMARRKGCFDTVILLVTTSRLSDLVVPHVRRQLSGVERDQPFPENLQRRKGAVCDGALGKQALLIVSEQFQALDLVPLDGALPAQQGRAVVESGLEDVLAGV